MLVLGAYAACAGLLVGWLLILHRSICRHERELRILRDRIHCLKADCGWLKTQTPRNTRMVQRLCPDHSYRDGHCVLCGKPQ